MQESHVASSPGDPAVVTVAELVAALRRQQGLRAPADRPRQVSAASAELRPVTCRQLEVVGAHPAAGATTMAVAVAEALAAKQDPPDSAEPVTLIAGALSNGGLATASRCEVASPAPGWGAGRRGAVNLRWPVEPVETSKASADPAIGWTVVDVGSKPPNDAPAGSKAPRKHWLLVCRATVPSVRSAEVHLERPTEVDVVVVVGVRRWPREVGACLGPRMRDVASAGRVVFVPTHRQLLLGGVDERPLPGCVRRAAGAALGVLWPEEFGFTRAGRGRGRA